MLRKLILALTLGACSLLAQAAAPPVQEHLVLCPVIANYAESGWHEKQRAGLPQAERQVLVDYALAHDETFQSLSPFQQDAFRAAIRDAQRVVESDPTVTAENVRARAEARCLENTWHAHQQLKARISHCRSQGAQYELLALARLLGYSREQANAAAANLSLEHLAQEDFDPKQQLALAIHQVYGAENPIPAAEWGKLAYENCLKGPVNERDQD